MDRLRVVVGLLGIAVLQALPVSALPPSVEFTSIERTDRGVSLQWEANTAGLQFTVESQSAITGGAWEALPTDFTWPAVTNRVLDTRTNPDTRFYRVRFEPIPGQRGRLISSTVVNTLSAGFLQFLFQSAGYPIKAEKDVRVLKINYETVDAHGMRTTASGELALPIGVTTPLPLASYQHGTVVLREDVPSRVNTEGLLGVAFATTGYAAVLPDYIGLGDSPGFHPFHHAKSEATAVVDLLRAGRAYCASNHIELTGQLFLAGYSQGGHATLAALREIEANHAQEFTVTACAAGAGAYDLSGTTLDRFLAGTPVPNSYYFPYLLASYVEVYGVADSLGSLLAPPWRTTIPPLFDGKTDGPAINAALPPIPLTAADPALVAAVRAQPDHPLRLALRDNDLFDWTPRSALRLYHCSGDQDISPKNSQVAFDRFQARGATQVQLIDPNAGANHTGCVQPTLLAMKAWFDSLR